MSTRQHPAIAAYQALRRQADNAAQLHFALLQQIWLEVRGDARQRPSDYALVLLRAMTAAYLVAQGRTQAEMRSVLVDVMEEFERSYVALYSPSTAAPPKDGARMRRTKWPGGNVVLFEPKKTRPRE